MSAVDAETSRRGATALDGLILASNRGMLDFVQRLGFRVAPTDAGPMFKRAVKDFRRDDGGVGMVGGTGIEPVTPRV
jgi:hypothetical protein